jgi:hypothetical protein
VFEAEVENVVKCDRIPDTIRAENYEFAIGQGVRTVNGGRGNRALAQAPIQATLILPTVSAVGGVRELSDGVIACSPRPGFILA